MLALLLTTGCYSQADFADDRATAACDWYDRCDLLDVLTYDDVDSCVAGEGPADTGFSCVAFDAALGRDCVDEIESAGCEDPEPASCDGVCAQPGDTGTSTTQ